MSTKPKVSFVVPCYNLAHLLPECVNSILSQTHKDFEVLIMDDCSPDNTPEVAQSFKDPRVQHIRNEPNLGHLRNYNKGISLSRGEYIWLISADDRLRCSYVLEKYVALLDQNPKVGYVFCPGVGLRDGKETEVLDYSTRGSWDRIFDGRKFLERLIDENSVIAASGMARKECYEKVSMFPLDMPWGGDWYLWCVFALHNDVGYFAEPMVNYREHQLSMTNHLMNNDLDVCASNDVELPWEIKRQAESMGLSSVARSCRRAIADEYAHSIARKRYQTSTSTMSIEQFEMLVETHSSNAAESSWLRSQVYMKVADYYYWRRRFDDAALFYRRACSEECRSAKAWLKYALLRTGKVGIAFRDGLLKARRGLIIASN